MYKRQTINTLIGLGKNPNIGGVIIVGLGCERVSVKELYDGIALSGKPVETLVIQELGGTVKTVARGVEPVSYTHLKAHRRWSWCPGGA